MALDSILKPRRALSLFGHGAAFLTGAFLFSWANFGANARYVVERPMEVAFPVPVQMLMSGADRYLAANIATLRATVVGVENLPIHTLQALAAIQEDAAWMNPGHEDNYYLAAAVLPWAGHVDAAQSVLSKAMRVRSQDVLPPFYYAFNQLNFRGDVDGAVRALRIAERNAPDPGAKAYFGEMAERWSRHQDDASYAVNVLKKMVGNTTNMELKFFLQRQLVRIEGLAVLKRAAMRYQSSEGKALGSLDELVPSGYLSKIPDDPTGFGYDLRNGTVFLKSSVLEQVNR